MYTLHIEKERKYVNINVCAPYYVLLRLLLCLYNHLYETGCMFIFAIKYYRLTTCLILYAVVSFLVSSVLLKVE